MAYPSEDACYQAVLNGYRSVLDRMSDRDVALFARRVVDDNSYVENPGYVIQRLLDRIKELEEGD